MKSVRPYGVFGVISLITVGMLSIAACQRSVTTPQATAQSSATATTNSTTNAENGAWTQFVNAFQEGYFKFDPPTAVAEGRHQFDGQLPDWSTTGIQQEIDWFSSERSAAAAFTKSSLSSTQAFEQEYLLAVIDKELFWKQAIARPFTNPAYYVESLDPSVYLTRPYAPLEQRMQAFIAYAKRIPDSAKHIRENLRNPLPKTFVTYAINGFGGYAAFYRHEVPPIFAQVKDKKLQTELTAAIGPAVASMQALAAWFKTQQATATDKYALGSERFAEMLQATERVTTPLNKLAAIGRADLQRNLDSLAQACQQLAPQATVKECVDKVKLHKPEGGAVTAGAKRLAELRQFIVDHNLVSIPSDEVALVAEAPAYNRANLAYISVPGPYDVGMPSTYYIAPPDPAWSKADQDAYVPSNAFLEFITVHEVWPGHFLQFLHANRSANRFGQLFVGYGFAEGWAHYTEEMMWDAGLGNGDPETHIGQLLNALMRNVRYVCAIGLHTQNMSVETCETMFRDQAFLDPGNAKQQAARGTYDPAYLNYTMSKLMIKKLREDWIATRGGRQAWHDFHDQFLSYGGPPVPLVRAQMLPGDTGELF